MKRVLITGVSGLLGSNLAFFLKDKFEILGLYHSRNIRVKGVASRWVDLRSFYHTEAILREFNPHIIIHCAALADVETCEVEPEQAREANVVSTANLVNSILDRDVKLIQISTDQVYDGAKGGFTETAPVGPLNYYGITKLDSERQALRHKNAAVLRTNFFGWGIGARQSLAQWLIAELRSGRQVKGFTDVFFSSIYTVDLAGLIEKTIIKDLRGIYNCGCRDSISKYEFLKTLAEKVGLDSSMIIPSSVERFPFKAKRPKNLSLDVSKLSRDLGCSIPTVEESLDHFVSDLATDYPTVMVKEFEKAAYKPYLDIIPYGRQAIDDDDLKAVAQVLYSSHLTQGPKVQEFERELSKFVGSAFCAAVNSGTSALHIACLAAGVSDGDEVITSPNTFVASANCAVYCGATPVFADIDPKTYNISPDEIENKLTIRTKAVIVVHFAGQSADMKRISAVVKTAERKFGNKIYIIEDASHALGSVYDNQKVGSCVYSDMTTFSFHPVKHITTGEGGAVLTNHKGLHRKLCFFRSHGITTFVDELMDKGEAFEQTDNDVGDIIKRPWYYEQQCLGFNYRITDIQCALGLEQLKKLPLFIKRRRQIVEIYNNSFKNIQFLQLPYESGDCLSNFHLYVLLFQFESIGKSRHQVISELKNLGMVTQVHYIPVHTQPYYKNNFGTHWGGCPVSEAYYRQCLSIPLFPALTDEEVYRVVDTIKKVIGV